MISAVPKEIKNSFFLSLLLLSFLLSSVVHLKVIPEAWTIKLFYCPTFFRCSKLVRLSVCLPSRPAMLEHSALLFKQQASCLSSREGVKVTNALAYSAEEGLAVCSAGPGGLSSTAVIVDSLSIGGPTVKNFLRP
jgi:hypothetical protein